MLAKKLLSYLTLFTFFVAFVVPSFILIEPAKASYNVKYDRSHTTYFLCRCPNGNGWVIVDSWTDPYVEIAWYNHPPKKNGKHVDHNVTTNIQTTSSYSTLSDSDYRCEALDD